MFLYKYTLHYRGQSMNIEALIRFAITKKSLMITNSNIQTSKPSREIKEFVKDLNRRYNTNITAKNLTADRQRTDKLYLTILKAFSQATN